MDDFDAAGDNVNAQGAYRSQISAFSSVGSAIYSPASGMTTFTGNATNATSTSLSTSTTANGTTTTTSDSGSATGTATTTSSTSSSSRPTTSTVPPTTSPTPPPPPTTAAAPPPPETSLSCAPKATNYIAQPDLAVNIKDYCKQAAQQGVQDPKSGSLVRDFNPETPQKVSISMNWPSGLDFILHEDECNQHMNRVMNDCHGNDPENPMGFKFGGALTVGKVSYLITPIAVRQPVPKVPNGGIDTTDKLFFVEFWIWGAGWANSDFGQASGGLLDRLRGCGVVSDWTFDYGIGDDGREWSARGKLPIWTEDCIVEAVGLAGGPKWDG
ncbi:MAG: hypothetical protein M1832_000655 [Thelocarpon impressellum]|nr:MAG: hypothetical protein M1832_000655 [Thelocarpon impressellum]